MRWLSAAVAVLLACDPPPPIKSSSGEMIDGVSFEETFALSSEVKSSSLRGERLRAGVALMDKHGVLAMKGEYKANGVLDKGTLTIFVKPISGAERMITFRSCASENVCKFFGDAVAEGIVDHTPIVCRNRTSCEAAK